MIKKTAIVCIALTVVFCLYIISYQNGCIEKHKNDQTTLSGSSLYRSAVIDDTSLTAISKSACGVTTTENKNTFSGFFDRLMDCFIAGAYAQENNIIYSDGYASLLLEAPERETVEGDDPSNAPSSPGLSAAPLTLEDFGISIDTEETALENKDADVATFTMSAAPMVQTMSLSAPPSYLNPQTLVVSTDNENNDYSGYADEDLNEYLYAEDAESPIEVRFNIDTLPVRNAYLAIHAFDCDETTNSMPEYDAVYVNSTKVGVLTGQNEEWNTTLISVPISCLHTGANYVTVHIGAKNLATGEIFQYYADTWAIEIKWFQLLLDGGDAQGKPGTFQVELQNAKQVGSSVLCDAVVSIAAQTSSSYEVEYSLVDNTSAASPTYLQIISTDTSRVEGSDIQTTGSLDFPIDSPSGEYIVQVLLKNSSTGEILAADQSPFLFESGQVPSFDVTDFTITLSTEELTTGPLTMYLSANIGNLVPPILGKAEFYVDGTSIPTILSPDVSFQSTHATASTIISENGTHLIEIRYIKDSHQYSERKYRIIDNIRKPSKHIISATLSPSSATVGDKLTIVVVTSDQVKRLSAVNNTKGKLTTAFSVTRNGDGTLTHTVTYKAEVANSQRYWIITAYDANALPLDTADTNTVIIQKEVKPQQYFLSLDTNSLSVPALVSEEIVCHMIFVTANAAWSYSCNKNWLDITKNSNNLEVTVNKDNRSFSSRECTITVKCGNIKKTIKVTQQGLNNEVDPALKPSAVVTSSTVPMHSPLSIDYAALNVRTGAIRFITQRLPSKGSWQDNEWKKAENPNWIDSMWTGYADKAGSGCTVSDWSMVMSALGVDMLPYQIAALNDAGNPMFCYPTRYKEEIARQLKLSKEQVKIDTQDDSNTQAQLESYLDIYLADHINDPKHYSPPLVRVNGFNKKDGFKTHTVVVMGKLAKGQYRIADSSTYNCNILHTADGMELVRDGRSGIYAGELNQVTRISLSD